MFISLLSLNFYLYIRYSQADPSHILPCFQAYPAGNAQPITTIYGTSLYDCLMTCLQWSGNYGDTCASVLWDDYQHSCYLFNQRASQNPGILLNRYGTTYYEKVGYTCTGAVTSGPPIGPTGQPSASSCPNKINTAYFTAAEVELASSTNQASTTLSEVPEENACISSCTDELGPSQESLPCTGLTALPRSGKCVVVTTKAQPTGSGILTRNPEAIYFEKFCLPTTAPADCFEQFFFLFPGKRLNGHDLSSASSTSLADCANQCVQQTPQCKAAVFSSASSTCNLKGASATPPFESDFVNGADTDYYFENGCLIPQNRTANTTKAAVLKQFRSRFRLLAVSEGKAELSFSNTKSKSSSGESSKSDQTWGLWSACQFQVGSRRARVRTRDCRSLTKCPDKDIEFDFCST